MYLVSMLLSNLKPVSTLFSPTKRLTIDKRFPYPTLVSWVVLGERVFPFAVFSPFVALHCFVAPVAFPQPQLLMIPMNRTKIFVTKTDSK